MPCIEYWFLIHFKEYSTKIYANFDSLKKEIERFRNKPKKERSKIYKKRAEYIKNYRRERYRNEQEFRKRHLEIVKKYKSRH